MAALPDIPSGAPYPRRDFKWAEQFVLATTFTSLLTKSSYPTIMSLPPNVTIPVTPFKIAIPDAAVEELKTLIKLSKFPPETYEGKHRKYGITRAWMEEARARWLNGYDW